jgi:hypothetical protein
MTFGDVDRLGEPTPCFCATPPPLHVLRCQRVPLQSPPQDPSTQYPSTLDASPIPTEIAQGPNLSGDGATTSAREALLPPHPDRDLPQDAHHGPQDVLHQRGRNALAALINQ